MVPSHGAAINPPAQSSRAWSLYGGFHLTRCGTSPSERATGPSPEHASRLTHVRSVREVVTQTPGHPRRLQSLADVHQDRGDRRLRARSRLYASRSIAGAAQRSAILTSWAMWKTRTPGACTAKRELELVSLNSKRPSIADELRRQMTGPRPLPPNMPTITCKTGATARLRSNARTLWAAVFLRNADQIP